MGLLVYRLETIEAIGCGVSADGASFCEPLATRQLIKRLEWAPGPDRIELMSRQADRSWRPDVRAVSYRRH